MPDYLIRYHERETMPGLLERRARELDITVEQLIHRLIFDGKRDYMESGAAAEPGTSLEDFLEKNGALKPK